MNTTDRERHSLWMLIVAWGVVVVTALLTRPLMPVDETRYVSVAWEMWLRGDFLVPYLNGEPYSHKPPLLFWLMQFGWWLFGVNDLWPRLVAPLLALANLAMTALLARRLWPERPTVAQLAPWLLFGCLLYMTFFTLVQFDLLLVFCTLLGMFGLVRAANGQGTGWLIVGLAIGLGLLSKGPVILLHVLPAALLGHFWVDRGRLSGWICWYGGIVAALLLGAVIGLAWALPAGQAGGSDYQHAIFWGQTAERVVDSFAHQKPVWWYLPWLPVLLLPWSVWPTLWRAARFDSADRRLRFLLCWALPVLVMLSLVSGKQVKYLLPMFPALALLGAVWLAGVRAPWRPAPQGLAALLMFISAALMLLPLVDGFAHKAYWVAELRPLWALAFVAAGLIWWHWRPADRSGAVRGLALVSALWIVLVHWSILRVAAPAYDLRLVSARIAALQDAGHPVGHVMKYHGQFQFLGRLRQPLEEVPVAQAMDWARAHPDGYLVLYYSDWKDAPRDGADLLQDYRGEQDELALWSAAKLLAAQ